MLGTKLRFKTCSQHFPFATCWLGWLCLVLVCLYISHALCMGLTTIWEDVCGANILEWVLGTKLRLKHVTHISPLQLSWLGCCGCVLCGIAYIFLMLSPCAFQLHGWMCMELTNILAWMLGFKLRFKTCPHKSPLQLVG